jgi:hypothetical protein
MSNQEFLTADQEVISMVRSNAGRASRMVGVIVSVEDARRLQAMDAARERQADPEDAECGDFMNRLLNTAGRGFGAMVIAGGMLEGLIDPMFGSILAGACIAWAAIYYINH